MGGFSNYSHFYYLTLYDPFNIDPRSRIIVVRRGAKTIVRYVKTKTKARRPRKNDLKKYGKKLVWGTVLGMLVAIPLSLVAKYTNTPALVELADRAGSVAASVGGGPVGVIGYQAADAIFDRFVVYNGQGVSGGSQVYM